MLVKVAVKPAVTLAKKLDLKKQEAAKSASSKENEAAKKSVDESDAENDEFIQVNYDKTQQEDLLLEMKINYLLETILLLRPDHLASLFLMYDCQPFSESVLTKSLLLIFRLSRKSPFTQIFQRLGSKIRKFT